MAKKTKKARSRIVDRKARLKAAPLWIKEFEGQNILRSYSKWYGVDKRCALKELEMLGVVIPESQKSHILKPVKKRNKHCTSTDDYGTLFGSDEYFAFIVGFTEGGAAFGKTHKQNIELLNGEMREDAFRIIEEYERKLES